ncbi:MAG TPA: hypothetical protein VLS45_07110, partial [Methylomicrobium sp.]|nr:hypothetical protein [Methylomicrobium sp.]
LFCLTVHPLLSSLNSNLTIGYLDDFTLGGPTSTVARDVDNIICSGEALGLHLNSSKCELINNYTHSVRHDQFRGFQRVPPCEATFLGAPLSTGQAMETVLSALHTNLKLAVDRLRLLSSHDALILLKTSLGGPKMQHVLRSSPCSDHPLLLQIDTTLKSTITQICNVTLSDDQWTQASLPVKQGGLGIRSVSMLAPSAFLASAAGTQKLQAIILRNCYAAAEDVTTSLARWSTLSGLPTPTIPMDTRQRSWDSAVTTNSFQSLLHSRSDPLEQARMLAAAAEHSGDWLHATPISACGLRLDDEAVRVAVCLRLGIALCQPHQCVCGATVDPRGVHIFSCKRNPGRSQRHHFIIDLICRALTRASIPSFKEPHGLARSDGKRPDGLTLIPWREGRSATWDVTISNTLAASYINNTSRTAAAAAEEAASRKLSKYADITQTHLFFPLAFETLGPINQEGQEFLSDLGRRISAITEDPRETSFLYQRLSIALQRFNAISLTHSFDNNDLATRPEHT